MISCLCNSLGTLAKTCINLQRFNQHKLSVKICVACCYYQLNSIHRNGKTFCESRIEVRKQIRSMSDQGCAFSLRNPSVTHITHRRIMHNQRHH